MPIKDYPRSVHAKAIGARIRRLSERIDRESGSCYALFDTRFEQRWFGIINQLRLHQSMSVGELASVLGITHVSVSQARKSLETEGLIKSISDPEDGRRSILVLTAAGERLVTKLAPLWSAMESASEELFAEADGLLEAIGRLEDALEARSLTKRIMDQLGDEAPAEASDDTGQNA